MNNFEMHSANDNFPCINEGVGVSKDKNKLLSVALISFSCLKLYITVHGKHIPSAKTYTALS